MAKIRSSMLTLASQNCPFPGYGDLDVVAEMRRTRELLGTPVGDQSGEQEAQTTVTHTKCPQHGKQVWHSPKQRAR